MNDDDIKEKLTSGISSVMNDHGLEWRRLYGREWAKTEHHTLMVSSRMDDGGYAFGVIDDATKEPVTTGQAPTRPEARRLAVFALAEVLGLGVATPTPEDFVTTHRPRETSRWLRIAAAALLLGIIGGVVVAIVVRVLS